MIYTQQRFCLSFSNSNIFSIFLDLLHYLECPGKELLNYDGKHTDLYFNKNTYDISALSIFQYTYLKWYEVVMLRKYPFNLSSKWF